MLYGFFGIEYKLIHADQTQASGFSIFRMPQGWMVTRIPALIFDGIVEIGCLYFLYFISPQVVLPSIYATSNQNH